MGEARVSAHWRASELVVLDVGDAWAWTRRLGVVLGVLMCWFCRDLRKWGRLGSWMERRSDEFFGFSVFYLTEWSPVDKN